MLRIHHCTVLVLLCFLTVVSGCRFSGQHVTVAPTELRGAWLTNVDSHVLDSRANIAEAMEFLAAHHFNIVFPVAWNKACTQYPSAVMDSLFQSMIDTTFAGRDPLHEVIEEAHKRGIAVIP